MRTTLIDIVKHTGGLGFLDTIKVTGDDKSTLVESMESKGRSVILKAKLLAPIEELRGVSGFTHLALLNGLLNYPNFKADGAVISVKHRETDTGLSPEEIIFCDEKGQTATYRLMNSKSIPDQPKFLGTTWDVVITPSVSKIKEFQTMAGLYASYSEHFTARTVDGELRLYIGDDKASMHKMFITIDENVDAKLSGDLYFPIQYVLNIMKLGIEENLQISISNNGALKLTMTSGFAQYDYILPARKK